VKTLADQGPLTNLIIRMCQLMNFHIVAEGVGTPDQLAWLADRKCDEHWGFLFSPAIDAASFEAMLTAEASLPRADVIQVHL
jgi:EAL domain-containing protein (putative c-di-GMP-specific phosphodiesterase class I)